MATPQEKAEFVSWFIETCWEIHLYNVAISTSKNLDQRRLRSLNRSVVVCI